MSNAIHRTHGLSVLAILQAYEAAQRQMPPEQIEEVNTRVDSGTGVLALLITNDGKAVHVELALMPKDGVKFNKAILRIDGPVMSAATPAEMVEIVDRNTMN